MRNDDRDPPQDRSTQQSAQSKQPVERVRDSGITASIWENEGQNGPYHNVTLSRSYKDADGQYQNTDSFRKKDLPILMEVTREAYARMRDRDHQVHQQRQQIGDDRNARRAAFEGRRSNPRPRTHDHSR